MNRTYGFEGEAKQKHGEQTYKVSRLFLAIRIPSLTVMHFLQLFAHVFTASKSSRSHVQFM